MTIFQSRSLRAIVAPDESPIASFSSTTHQPYRRGQVDLLLLLAVTSFGSLHFRVPSNLPRGGGGRAKNRPFSIHPMATVTPPGATRRNLHRRLEGAILRRSHKFAPQHSQEILVSRSQNRARHKTVATISLPTFYWRPPTST